MVFAPDQRWISAFANVVREVMDRCGCTPNSCVEAACIGAGVSKAHGYLVEPVPVAVQVLAGNQATVLPGPAGRRGNSQRSGFDGHLILHFPAARVMVDLTADQFNSPRRGLLVPGPIIGPIAREQLAGQWAVAALPTGTEVRYREMIGNVAWRALPAWRESSELVIGIADRALRAQLSGAKRGHSARHL